MLKNSQSLYVFIDALLYKIDIIDKKKVKNILSPIPVFIKSILENVDTLEQKVELLYYRPQLNKWQTIIIDKNIISDTRSVVTLANKGIPVNSSNAKRFVDYFYWLEQENLINIPILKTTNTMGWHLENSCFVPFTDKVLLGISKSKAFYIVANKEKDDLIRDFLVSLPGVGTTVIDAEGGYSSDNQTLLLAVVPTRDYFVVKEGLKEIDKNIFFLVCDSYEVSNNGDQL